jgi:hypothetical protein
LMDLVFEWPHDLVSRLTKSFGNSNTRPIISN